MFNLSDLDDRYVWPEHLKPEGYGDHLVEPFETWRDRHSKELSHIPKEVLEQWVYRHWSDSIATFVPLEGLSCSEEVWPTIDFIGKIGTFRGNEPMDPEHDWDVFSGRLDGRKQPAAIALDQGEWDYAPIVLRTPDVSDGFIDGIQEHIKKPYFLIEGHKRRRHFNALLHKGLCIKNQRIFVLTSQLVG